MRLSLEENGLNQLTISWCLNENVQVAFFDTREYIRQSQEGVQRFDIIDAFESFFLIKFVPDVNVFSLKGT